MKRLFVTFGLATLLPLLLIGWYLGVSSRDAIETRALELYAGNSQTTFHLMADTLLSPEDFESGLSEDRIELLDRLIARLGPSTTSLVRMVGTDGKVLYSTEGAEIGSSVSLPPTGQAALDGRPRARFTEGGEESLLASDDNHVELFLPITLGGDDEVIGLVEAVGLNTTLRNQIDADVRRQQLVILVGLGLLWLCLFPIVSHVSRRLRRQSEENQRLAFHDPLTGLPNRSLLQDRLEQGLALADRTGLGVGLLMLDLDRFKDINDSLGHTNGDRLLQQVAARFESVTRADDTVARLGGDEFAMVVNTSRSTDQIAAVADRLARTLDAPFDLDGTEVTVTASIGIAAAPHDGNDAGWLLQRADIAMFAAKEASVDVIVYSPNLDVQSPSRLSLTTELGRALDTDPDQLRLHHQLTVRPDTGEVHGTEALLRWQHPTRGPLPPGEFIPLAEQSGLIRRLTEHVLEQSIRQARQWMDDGHDLVVSVNLSARNLRETDLPDRVASLLHSHGLAPERLELEVTETAVLRSPHTAMRLLADLRAVGVRIALDDFGTGYSSLTYLKNLPADQIKIDRSFVAEMNDDPTTASIVRSVIDLAHSLGMAVTAEGVETPDQLDTLVAFGCDLVQGFYLEEPCPAAQVPALLNAPRPVFTGREPSRPTHVIPTPEGTDASFC